MMELKTSDWLSISTFLLTISLIMLWCLDTSVSAMLNNGYCTNGFIRMNPLISYHIALAILIITSFLQTLIFLHVTLKQTRR